jgi:DNA mismatch repair protein MutH
LAERSVGSAFFWQPSAAEEAQLKADWQEHMDRIALGQVEQIRAQQGEVLQLRPKAAHGRVLTAAIGPYGQAIETLPRGFYLRKEFTRALLQQAFPSAAANSAE